MTLNEKEIKNQGLVHYQSIRHHTPVMPPTYLYPSMDYDDAYAIANDIVKRYQLDGFTIAGKKVGLTSQAMRNCGGIYEPDYGFIFNETCYPNETTLNMSDFVQPGVEAEIAFKLKADLIGENISPDDVLRATEYIVLCLEIVDVRQKLDIPRKIFDSIADNASYGAFIIGDTPVMPYTIDLGLIGYVYEHNNHQTEVSCGAAVLDHPANAVAWLANKFYRLGTPLKAGEFVLSGSAITLQMAQPGDNFRCRYGKLGEVSVNFV